MPQTTTGSLGLESPTGAGRTSDFADRRLNATPPSAAATAKPTANARPELHAERPAHHQDKPEKGPKTDGDEHSEQVVALALQYGHNGESQDAKQQRRDEGRSFAHAVDDRSPRVNVVNSALFFLALPRLISPEHRRFSETLLDIGAISCFMTNRN